MTPTRSRPAIFTPVENTAPKRAGTFQRPYTKDVDRVNRSLSRGRQHVGRFGDALLGGDERVLVLDGDRVDPALALQSGHESLPPCRVTAAADDGKVPGQGLGIVRPAPVEQSVHVEVGSREPHVLAV